MPVYGNKTVWCIVVFVIVVLAGFAYGLIEQNAKVTSANGTVYVDAKISMSRFTGQGCEPLTYSVEDVLTIDLYDKLVNLTKQESLLISQETVDCVVAARLCYTEYGQSCDLSGIYPVDLTATPDGISVLGYVLGVNLALDNKLPAQIENVNATSNGKQLPTNSVKSSCNAHCSLDVNITLGPVAGPTEVTLTIDTKMPLNWFMWGNFGMIQKTIVVSFEFVASSMTVQFE